MKIEEVEHYVKVIIPNIENELGEEKDKDKLLELYNLYEDILALVSPYDFISYNKLLEFEEDKTQPNKGFYHHRKDHVGELFDALNDMEIYDKYDLLLISLPPRIGKEQPLSSKILTPSGWDTMGNMKVGKEIIGDDGKVHNVTGVFPQGSKDVYEITFDDGTKVKCGLEHLWEVQTRDDRRHNKSRVVTVEEMMKNLYVENSTRKNYSIKYVEPVQFNDTLSDDDIHPYVLGALIGDGGLNEGVKFTNVDEEVLNKMSELISDGEILKRVSDTITFNIKDEVQKRNSLGYPIPCETLSKIREYGLVGTSHTKFIPKKYLYSSEDNRIELLRGLMDTDGYCGNNSHNEFTTVSEQLSKDVIELIRSLGGRATCSTKVGTYVKNDIVHECSFVYRISFNMTINPFYTSRKANKFKPRVTRRYKYIKSIELVGNEECQCIMVDNPSHLYVTDGYNITHNTTSGIRFLSWIMGKYPESTQLATSYSDNITSSFYIGTMEILQSDRFKMAFGESNIVSQNAKRQEIWLKVAKRYPTVTFVPVGGSVTGRCEAEKYLYCDDLVSGIEEALSVVRLNKLNQIYTINFKQRKKDGAKEIHVATAWSVHDPISVLKEQNVDNPRCKIINVPCYDENGESNFDYFGGFSTEYYKELEATMDSASFSALYLCEPIEREGLLYHEEDMQYYLELPDERPDTILSVCDSKALGKDNVASPIAYIYGDFVYIEDVVYDDGLPEITVPKVARTWNEHNVVRGDVEMNNGGNFFAVGIDNTIKQLGGNTSIRMFFTSQNKQTKIITYSDFVQKKFIFKDKSTYSPHSDYAKFMKDVFRWTQSGKNEFDDAPDSLAMLAQLVQDVQGNSIKVIDRRSLGI